VEKRTVSIVAMLAAIASLFCIMVVRGFNVLLDDLAKTCARVLVALLKLLLFLR
jgi:hypothetical protein